MGEWMVGLDQWVSKCEGGGVGDWMNVNGGVRLWQEGWVISVEGNLIEGVVAVELGSGEIVGASSAPPLLTFHYCGGHDGLPQ